MKKWKTGSGHTCTRQIGNECGHNNVKFANMGLGQRPPNPSILVNKSIISNYFEISQDKGVTRSKEHYGMLPINIGC